MLPFLEAVCLPSERLSVESSQCLNKCPVCKSRQVVESNAVNDMGLHAHTRHKTSYVCCKTATSGVQFLPLMCRVANLGLAIRSFGTLLQLQHYKVALCSIASSEAADAWCVAFSLLASQQEISCQAFQGKLCPVKT